MEDLGVEFLKGLRQPRAPLARSILTCELLCIVMRPTLIWLTIQQRKDSHLLYEAMWVIQSTVNLRVGARIILSRKQDCVRELADFYRFRPE